MNILLLLKKKKKNFLRRRKTLDLETVILSEVRQTEKHKYVISLTCGIGKKKKIQMNLFTKQKSRASLVAQW